MPSTATEIAIRPVESTDELRKALNLMARVHIDGDVLALRWLEDCASQYPGFRPDHTRIAVRNSDIVAALRLTTETVRIGEARLKMGGLGWVATAAHYRRKGICRRLIDDTLRYMREHNYHVSMLFGIPDFYHRFGFVTSLSDYSIVMDTREAMTFRNPFKVAFARPGEADFIQRTHNANDLQVTCSLLRSTAHMHNKWARWNEWVVFKDDQGSPVGYLLQRREADTLNIDEVGLTDRSICAAIVGYAGRTAEEFGLSRVRFHVPPDHIFARFIGRFRTVHERRVDRGAGGMMAFVHIGETLESMIPEWERLVQQSVVRDSHAEVTLIVDGLPYRIRSHRGAIDVAGMAGTSKIALSKAELMHLVTGYIPPLDVLEDRRCMVLSEARQLFATIFPSRHPYVWLFDRF